MFKEVKANVKDFVEKQKREREQRKTDRDRHIAALCIQAGYILLNFSAYRNIGVVIHRDRS